jgi:hypothetical protein
VTSSTRTGRVVVANPYRASGPGPLVGVPPGWSLERVAADDVLADPGTTPPLTEADVLVAVGGPALGVRIAATTGARLFLADATERKIVLPRPDAARTRSAVLPGVAVDRGDLEPISTYLVCRSPHGDALRVFSDDGRSSTTREVVLDTGDPLDLRAGSATFQPPPTPWEQSAQVVAQGGGTLEIVVDAGRARRARHIRITPGAFGVTLIERS